MTANRNAITQEIASAFSLSDDEARAACLLLEARARTLDYTFDEYIERYHPEGIAGRDEGLPDQFEGYVRFLGEDASAVLRAGRGANFSTFVHECSHVFRRQLAGELREQAEKAFGVTGNDWSAEKEEQFARGLEQWIKRHHRRDRTRADIYNKGKQFVDTVYRGMERIVDIDPDMEAVYEKLFEENKYIFNQNEFENTLRQAAEGTAPKEAHVFLGMTPRIYEELGFQRLPMAITRKHLYSALRANGAFEDFHYHDLGEDLLRQLPEQLKKPLCIIQSDEGETDIISIIALRDKENRQIIVPIAQSQKGNFNEAEIDINLVKSVYGRKGFESWLKEAIDDNRLLYADKKKTEPALDGKLPHTFQGRSILPPGLIPPDVLQDVFGFTENIARYQEAVKRKFPERFIRGERILYKSGDGPASQLSLDFAPGKDTAKPQKDEDISAAQGELSELQNEYVFATRDRDSKETGYLSRLLKDIEIAAQSVKNEGCKVILNDDFKSVMKDPGFIERLESEIAFSGSDLGRQIPHPNTPENFERNFASVAASFKSDPIEAARFLLRAMPKEGREAALADMRNAGCADKESYHRYLHKILDYAQMDQDALKQQTAEYELRLEALRPDMEAAEAANNKDGPLSGALIGEYNKIQNEIKILNKLENKNTLDVNNTNRQDESQNIDTNDHGDEKLSSAKRLMDENFELLENYINKEISRTEFRQKLAEKYAVKEINEIEEFAATLKPTKDAFPSPQPNFRPFGAWTDFSSRLSTQERERYNGEALSVIEKADKGILNEADRAALSRYSGFGGISADGERGVLYDYYTSPPVAHIAWKLLEKSGLISEGSRILEPSCGTGVFLEYAPKGKSLHFTGIELDKRTAEISRLLHESDNSVILQQSFEAFNFSEYSGGFDHVIGNAPFGERSANLVSLDMPGEKSLDNYFVMRSIDNLKENGTMALIVAPGVLENKANEQFRMEINKKAQLIGAVKLPNRSFHHTHTQIMPDILLFRKYPDDIRSRLSPLDDEAFKATPLYDPDFVGGKYFEKHPEHIAGELSKGTGQWGGDEVKGDITKESIETIVGSFAPAGPIPEDIFEPLRAIYQEQAAPERNADMRLDDAELKGLEAKTLRHGAIKLADSKVYLLSENHSWKLISGSGTLARKIGDIKAIAETVRAIQEGMKAEAPQAGIREKQKDCRARLSEYLEAHGALPAEDQDIRRFTRDYPAVQGVYEALLPPDDPLLTSENVYRKNVEILDGHNAAVAALLGLREGLKDGTEENIRARFPDAAEALMAEMRKHGDIFITPEGQFQLREDFISGDAWGKIDELRAAAEREAEGWKKEKLAYGAGELEKAVGWTPIEDADFSPRSSWIPEEIVREWASSSEALGNSRLGRLAKNEEGKWGTLYGGAWQEAADPLIYYLNGQKQRSKYYDTEAFSKEHDELFRSFISSHEAHRSRLESEYNRKFKTHIIAPVKTYPVGIAGWRNAEAGGKTLKPHQWQSVHHAYREQRGISALGTGFGKTAMAIALESLLRQEGKARRIFLQVPNNKVKDWIEETKNVMPSLKIASIDPEEPGYSSRDKRYAKYQQMARSDADIILMPESAASEIQLSPENDAKATQKVSSLYGMEKEGGTDRQKESAALRGEYKAQSGKTNVTVCFEDFGCDAIIVDEAHRYKNLFSSTLSRETGLNDGRQSAKAMSLYKKCEYVREQNDQKNVFLLTATPLTNSPLEYYNMMQFVAPEELRRMGVSTIDGFIREFARIETGWTYDWGSGLAKQGKILTGFKNLQTLQNLFFTYTDLQNNPDAVGIEKPFSENQPHVIAADEKQTGVIRDISAELDRYRSLKGEEREDEFPGQNFLTFYSQMRTASLDLELYDPQTYKGWKNPKLEALSKNAYENFKKTNGGQVIFCDRVFSSDASLNIHEKIKKELVAQGFKEKEIVIVNGFTKAGGAKSDSAIEKEVSKAIADYNAGKYKAIIGSTACIGEGVNLQKNSSAVHHFDIPFRPSDFIQRNGRVDRQGNEQEKVGLHTYLASGTIDNYSVNLVQRKANWIDQLLRTKSSVFTNPNDENSIDADELLLALSEEWGDKDAALKRREKLETQKREKIKEAQSLQMKAQLKNLSLARGALEPLQGKEHTEAYRKRIEQTASLEASLKTNPAFKKHDLLENREPFLYSGNDDKIYRKGDILITRSGTFLVESFNFKKQELACAALETDEERKERIMQARLYGRTAEKIVQRQFKLTELGGKEQGRGYSYSEALHHIEKASGETKKAATLANSKEFYSLPEGVKAEHYGMHISVTQERYGGCNPAVFSLDPEGALKIKEARYRNTDDGEAINPFTTEGKDLILKALDRGIKFDRYGRADLIETIAETLPDLKSPVERAIEKAEAKEQEASLHEAALKKELLRQAAVKTNADKDHLKSRVHVVRF